MATKGKLILLMGPSGSGKNTLKDYVREMFGDRLIFLVSHTSRAMRPGEEDGKTYYYITREAFERMVKEGQFIEWTEYSGNYYGTLRASVEDGLAMGRILFADLEMHGYEQIKQLLPRDAYTLIFVNGGDWEHLSRRITKRAPMSTDELALRKKTYEAQMTLMSEADYVVVNEDGKLDVAQRQIEIIIQELLA